MNQFKFLIMASACLVAGACASPVETRLSSAGQGMTPQTQLTILTPDESGAPTNSDLNLLIEKSLTAHGYSLLPDGGHILEYAFSSRPADISLYDTKQSQGSAKKQIYRLTLSVRDRVSGAMLYQGAAEETHRRGTAPEAFPYLVDAVVADMSKPGVQRLLTRKGRN